jgi:hypothetical protein
MGGQEGACEACGHRIPLKQLQERLLQLLKWEPKLGPADRATKGHLRLPPLHEKGPILHSAGESALWRPCGYHIAEAYRVACFDVQRKRKAWLRDLSDELFTAAKAHNVADLMMPGHAHCSFAFQKGTASFLLKKSLDRSQHAASQTESVHKNCRTTALPLGTRVPSSLCVHKARQA